MIKLDDNTFVRSPDEVLGIRPFSSGDGRCMCFIGSGWFRVMNSPEAVAEILRQAKEGEATSRAVRLATVHDPDGGETTVRLTIEVLGGTARGFSADAMIDTISVMVEGADADDLGAAEEAISGGRINA